MLEIHRSKDLVSHYDGRSAPYGEINAVREWSRRMVRYWIRTIKEKENLHKESVRSAWWKDKKQEVVVHYMLGVLGMVDQARRSTTTIIRDVDLGSVKKVSADFVA